jgi:hypothetical protein
VILEEMVIAITRGSRKGAAAVVFAAISACQPVPSPAVPTPAAALPLAADIDTLASREFGGRQAGTPGDDSTADFLARRYQRLGLRPAFRWCASPELCRPSYFQRFETREGVSHNVGVIVDGLDSASRAEYVVVGAHFDHLGRSPTYSMDRDAGFVLRPGADDNASGTAAVLELAKRFAEHRAKCSILFLNFDAEELGLLGSHAFLSSPPVSKSAMLFMLNLDMVGRLRLDQLFIETVETTSGDRFVLERAAKAAGLRAHFVADDARSDHENFGRAGIPAVQVTTGTHGDYHTRADIAARINAVGLAHVVDFAEQVVRSIADR